MDLSQEEEIGSANMHPSSVCQNMVTQPSCRTEAGPQVALISIFLPSLVISRFRVADSNLAPRVVPGQGENDACIPQKGSPLRLGKRSLKLIYVKVG